MSTHVPGFQSFFLGFYASFGRHCVNISGMVIKRKREMTYQLSDCGILGRR